MQLSLLSTDTLDQAQINFLNGVHGSLLKITTTVFTMKAKIESLMEIEKESWMWGQERSNQLLQLSREKGWYRTMLFDVDPSTKTFGTCNSTEKERNQARLRFKRWKDIAAQEDEIT